jgi:tripartite-type tricarboxylate transporter receptor subunit TctC
MKTVLIKRVIYMTCCLVISGFLLSLFHTGLEKAWAADAKYPSRPIDSFCPTPAGSYTDIVNRIMAKQFEKYLNAVVVPGNKPGGGDMVCASAIANAPPDGYTMGLLADGPMVYSHLLGRATFGKDDLRVVGQLFCTTLVMDVNADSPWKTFQEFMDYAHKNPGLTYSHIGVGTLPHIYAELLNKVTNLQMRGVPYSGMEAITALLGKHVTAGFNNYGQAKQLEGKIRILFSFTPSELSPEPSVTSISTYLGRDKFEILQGGNYLVVPGKTPDAIVDALEKALEKTSKDPEFIAGLKKIYAHSCFVDGRTIQQRIPVRQTQIKPILQSIGVLK